MEQYYLFGRGPGDDDDDCGGPPRRPCTDEDITYPVYLDPFGDIVEWEDDEIYYEDD